MTSRPDRPGQFLWYLVITKYHNIFIYAPSAPAVYCSNARLVDTENRAYAQRGEGILLNYTQYNLHSTYG